MPPGDTLTSIRDSLAAVAGPIRDTFVQVVVQTPPEKAKSLLERATTGNGAIDTVLVTAIVTLAILGIIRLIKWWMSAAILRYYKPGDIAMAKQHFIPNAISIQQGPKGKEDFKTLMAGEGAQVVDFISYIKTCEHRFFFLTAPTGVGKTSFLSNVYAAYEQDSRRSKWPTLLFGHFHSEDTWTVIRDINNLKEGEHLKTLLLPPTKYKIQKPSKTILLLDGLDEFVGDTFKTADEFWDKLAAEWTKRSHELPRFQKVVIAVREQFLQFEDDGRDGSDRKGLKTYAINGQKWYKMRLQPFDAAKAEAFIELRYKENKAELGKARKNRQAIQQIEATNALNAPAGADEATSILGIPLVLNYIHELDADDIRKQREERLLAAGGQPENEAGENDWHTTVANRYDVYSVIVDNWLEREKEDMKLADDDDLNLLMRFSEELAFHMLHRCGLRAGQRIPEGQFLDFEAGFFARQRQKFTTHFTDRSLLMRDQENKVGFVHGSFQEYFLASYAIRKGKESLSGDKKKDTELKEARAAIDSLLSSDANVFARDMVLRWGWDAVKGAKKPAPFGKSYTSKFPATLSSVPPVKVAEDWLRYIESVSSYESIQTMLLENLGGTLGRIDMNWRAHFTALEELYITNDVFYKADIPNKRMQRFIRFFRDFIVGIELRNIPTVGEELACFDGTRNVKKLTLERMELNENPLRFFLKSRNSLQHFAVGINNLSNDALIQFSGVGNLWSLELCYNFFTAEILAVFKNSFSKLSSLLFQNHTGQDDTEVFEILPARGNWRELGFSHASFVTLYDYYLAGSQEDLTKLTLSDVGLTDEDLQMLSSFPNLTHLALTDGGLTGTGFIDFFPGKHTLEEIHLDSNPLREDAIDALCDFSKLKILSLLNCSPQNPKTIAALRAKGIKVIITYDDL